MTGANVDIPEYDFVISDGVNSVGLKATADKPSAVRRIPRGQGVEDKDHVQSDWSGGRGASVVEADPDKFYDSYSAWTDRAGQVTPAPLPGFGIIGSSGVYAAVNNWPSRTAANAPYLYTSVSAYLATKITITSTYGVPYLFFWAATSGNFSVEIRNDSSGSPGSVVASSSNTVTAQESGVRLYGVQFGGVTLVSGSYWLVIRNPGGITLEVVTNATTTNTATSTDGSSWTLGTGLVPYYYFGSFSTKAYSDQTGGIFFEYKRALYYVTQTYSQHSILLMNGIRGLANATSSSVATILSPTGLVNDQFTGCAYMVTNTQYAGEASIIGTEVGQAVTFTGTRRDYGSPHEYTILGADTWVERLAVLSGGRITDVAVAGEWVYLARGDGYDLIRYREYNNAGTWTIDAVVEAGVRAEKLKIVTRAGKKVIYRIWGGSSGLARQYFSKADVPTAWGTALTFGADAPVSTDGSPCQAILDFDGTIWLTTESDWYEIHDTGAGEFVAKRPGPSETSMRDPNNGLGATWWNSNVFATYGEGYMRGYGHTIDDIGPNRGEGMPSDRRGNALSAVPMFGTMAVSIGQYNFTKLYSSILTTLAPGGSWHEFFRAPYTDVWIQSLFYQSIPGISNRLWFTIGSHLMYLVMPNSAQNPLNDYQLFQYGSVYIQTGMLYAPTAQFTTGWIDFGNPDLDHYWRQLRVFTENLGAGATKPGFGTNLGTGLIKASITTWPSTESTLTDITTSPVQYVTVKKKGKRAQLKFELRSSNASIPAVLRSYTLRGRQMNEVKFDVQINFTHMNQMQLLNGSQALDANEQVAAVMAQFDAWQENGDLLTLTSRIKIFDGLEGHIDPVPVTPTAWENETADISGNVVFRQL